MSEEPQLSIQVIGLPLTLGLFLFCGILFSGCSDTATLAEPQTDVNSGVESYLDPTSDSYMSGPTKILCPDSAEVFLDALDYVEFQDRLLGFLESNNESRFREHFKEFYIPEVFKPDSLFEQYIRMYNQWDSIGVQNRLDRWTLRYVSPFFEGETYDVAIAEVDIRHHMAFEKRWTGNYRNFGRTLAQRYPGGQIAYMDTTFEALNGDTIYRRHITSEATRLIYAIRGHGDSPNRPKDIRWLPDGWQLQPSSVTLMDSTAVAQADLHRDEHGRLKQRPPVTGR
jgi:hypothetical protein